ncbi:hypothetical protein ACFL6X_03050 [Candidatus Latescibacterota bacterium]
MRANKKKMAVAVAVAWAALWAGGCGEYTRDNPVDPRANGGMTLRDQLTDSWSRVEEGANELYTFKSDGRVERREFSSPTGGEVDRNAAFPLTRVRIYEGTFSLVGDQLEIYYTKASSNDTDDSVSVPPVPTTARITIRHQTLTMAGSGGTTFYTRHTQ